MDEFNIYYECEPEGKICFTRVERWEVLDVIGRILDAGGEITGVINSEDD